jgi:uncharacterized membrane protein YdjX (TVP38/TMEM64 family)
LLWAAVVGGAIAAARFAGAVPLRELLQRISGLGRAAPLVFIAIYVVACVLFIPGSILTLSAGFLFGVSRGSIYTSTAATIGATIAFLIGRHFVRQWVAMQLFQFPKFKAVDDAVAHEGWKIVALTRLSPLFPFNLLNYAFGLTRVRLRDYLIASWAGTIPDTVLYVYLGSPAGDLTRVAAGSAERTPLDWVFYGVGLFATIAVAVYVSRISRRALEQFT